MKNLKANIFIDIGVLNIYNILLDLDIQNIVIIKYNNLKILIYYITKLYSKL